MKGARRSNEAPARRAWRDRAPAVKAARPLKRSAASPPLLLENLDDVRVGLKALRRTCPILRTVHDRAGDPPLRRRPGGLAGLARIVVGQQVSVASAAAIWQRCEAVLQPFDAARLIRASDEDYRAAGLSRPKVKTLRALGAAVAGGLDLDALAHLDPDEARAALTAVSGIGPWTADIYLMFCVGRADVFAPGDLALKEAVRVAFGLDERPSTEALAEIAARWAPWRAVAAYLLWHEYARAKAVAGAPV